VALVHYWWLWITIGHSCSLWVTRLALANSCLVLPITL